MEKLSRTQKLGVVNNNTNNPGQNQNPAGPGLNEPYTAPVPTGFSVNQPNVPNQQFQPPQQLVNPFAEQPQNAQPAQPINPYANQYPSPVPPVINPTMPQPVNNPAMQPPLANQMPPFNPLFNQQPEPVPQNQFNQYPNSNPVPPIQPLQQPQPQPQPNFGQVSQAGPFGPMEPVTPTVPNNDEFLDSLLREAKQYNINQGVRTAQDTQSNVIESMKSQGVIPAVPQQPMGAYPNQPLPPSPNPNLGNVNLTNDFENTVRLEAQQVYNQQVQPSLEEQISSLTAGDVPPVQPQPQVQPQPLPPEPVAPVIQPTNVVFETGNLPKIDSVPITTSVEGDLNANELDNALQEKIASETQLLQTRITDYENELDDVNGTVTYTNRVLNVILIFLILGLTVVLGVVVYWILNVRGII